MLSFIITWGRERESGIHLLKISLNSLSGESSCSRRTVEEEVDAAMKEGGQGWGLGPPSLCHEARGSLCFSCVLLTVTSMPCLARGSPGWCSHLVSLLRSTPLLPLLIGLSPQSDLCLISPSPSSQAAAGFMCMVFGFGHQSSGMQCPFHIHPVVG